MLYFLQKYSSLNDHFKFSFHWTVRESTGRQTAIDHPFPSFYLCRCSQPAVQQRKSQSVSSVQYVIPSKVHKNNNKADDDDDVNKRKSVHFCSFIEIGYPQKKSEEKEQQNLGIFRRRLFTSFWGRVDFTVLYGSVTQKGSNRSVPTT